MKHYVLKACEEYVDPRDQLTKKRWHIVGRATVFNDQTRGIMSMNHIPNVSYQMFEVDSQEGE